MNFKISVLLLHIFATTLPIGQNSMESFSVQATDINVNQTHQPNMDQMTTVTATQPIITETCTDRFCYNLTGEHISTDIDMSSTAPKGYDHYRSSSILYGILALASEQYQSNQCDRELRQIYRGIHRKEIWAIKGIFAPYLETFVYKLFLFLFSFEFVKKDYCKQFEIIEVCLL